MIKIFKAPSQVKLPEISFEHINQYQDDCDVYIEELKALLQRGMPKGKNVGEIIKFPVADGYAQYMVASMKPLQLVHIDLWDGWHFEFIHLITSKEVQLKIDQEKKLKELFGNKK